MTNRGDALDSGLSRSLGGWDVTAVVVGAIIGVGIFFAPSQVAKLAGSAPLALLAWLLGGLIALFGALTLGELGRSYPGTGAQYAILRDAYGPAPAFVFVFCNATAIQAGAIAIISIVCAQHIAVAVGGSNPGWSASLPLAGALIVGLAVANTLGVRWGARIQNLTVIAKLATIAAVVSIALLTSGASGGSAAAEAPAQPPSLGWAMGFLAAIVPTLFSFGGWQQALWIGGEVRDPSRNVPRAILGGVAIVIVAYLAINWAYLDLLGAAGVAASKTLASDAVAARLGDGARRVVASAVALSAFGVLNAQFLAGPRLVLAMARDGRFFAPFGKASSRFRTPAAAIALLGLLALALLLAAGERALGRLLTGVVFVDGVFFALTGLALLVLGRRQSEAAPRRRIPALVPLLFVIGELGVVLGTFGDRATRQAAVIGVVWIAAAGVVYALFFRRR